MRKRNVKRNSINGRSWRGHRVGDWRIGNRAGYSPTGPALWHATHAVTGVAAIGWVQWRTDRQEYRFHRMLATDCIAPERWLGNLRSLRGILGRTSQAGCYSDLGISVCDRWNPQKQGGGYRGSFRALVNFVNDMGERPSGTTIDRINPYGNYTQTNCRWADRITQAHNKRANFEG